MAGYNTRQSTYTDGDVINAADSNDEFDQLIAAFNASTGHNHDGTAGEGSRVTVVGTAADNVTFGTALTPDANNTIDIGTSSNQFKDLYIDGTANIDSLVADTADINGGTMDGVVIGGVTAAAADFTTVNSTGAMIATGGFQGVLTGSVLGNTTVTTGTSTFNNVTVNGTMTGNVTGDLTGDVTGNADTATALETARNFSLTGDVTATAVSFDGSGNVALSGSLAAGVVDTAELAANAVTTAKITDSNVTNAKLANSSVTINTNSLSLGGTLTLDTDDVGEGTSNLYFTNERVDDRVNGLLTAGSNITLTYDDTANTLTIASTDTEDDLSNNDTDDLSEGTTNLYFTNTRADARITNAVGSTVQAYDAGLTSIAGLTTAANKVIYTTASDTYAVTDFTAFGRSLVDDADAAAGRTTLGLGTAATQTVGTSANNVVQLDGSARLPAVDGSQLTNISFTESDPQALAFAIALG